VCVCITDSHTNESWLVTRNVVIIQIYISDLTGSMDVREINFDTSHHCQKRILL